MHQKPDDQEFYDALSDFVDDKIESLPASTESAIQALRLKANKLEAALKN